MKRTLLHLAFIPLFLALPACKTGLNSESPPVRTVPIGEGWSRNSVNAVIFRTHAVTTHKQSQYASYYDDDGRVILARRTLGESEWEVHDTDFRGNTRDAHNAISIAVDGAGYVHLSWDHHGHPLTYRRSLEPGSFAFTEALSMTGRNEDVVTYPEFYHLADGGFVFMYRHGASGDGRILLNRYNAETREWSVLQHPLIDGEGRRNAYTNALAIDSEGNWHLSWIWRDTPDVATNHNICYAVSPDEGRTWYASDGRRYQLPITYDQSEVVREIPVNSDLINQCSMTVDSRGRPVIAMYWRAPGEEVPQYYLVWHEGEAWRTNQVSERTTPFRLAGGGTRRIPISRPKVAVDDHDRVYVIYRDEERGGRISVARSLDSERVRWEHRDLSENSVGQWEPNFDVRLWERDRTFHIFKQFVGQGQAETIEEIPPQTVSILEWTP
jgi:hypothetical protein